MIFNLLWCSLLSCFVDPIWFTIYDGEFFPNQEFFYQYLVNSGYIWSALIITDFNTYFVQNLMYNQFRHDFALNICHIFEILYAILYLCNVFVILDPYTMLMIMLQMFCQNSYACINIILFEELYWWIKT